MLLRRELARVTREMSERSQHSLQQQCVHVTVKVERGRKKADWKFLKFVLIQCVFSIFLCSALFMWRTFSLSVYMLYSGKNYVWHRAGDMLASDLTRNLQVSFLDKQYIFDLFTLLTVVICISSPFDRFQLSILALFFLKHHHCIGPGTHENPLTPPPTHIFILHGSASQEYQQPRWKLGKFWKETNDLGQY